MASIRVPGTDGFFGILPNHAPMLAAVGAGPLSIHDTAGRIENMFIADGFLEVRNNKVRVVVDSGEPVTEIDLKRAEEAETRARSASLWAPRETSTSRAPSSRSAARSSGRPSPASIAADVAANPHLRGAARIPQ